MRLTKRDDEILLFLFHVALYATSRQIGERFFDEVAPKYRLQAVWRRMTKLAENGFVRAIEQPVYRSERSGTKPFIYALDRRGATHVAALTGIHPRQINTRPRARERNLSMAHDLGIVNYHLALYRSCAEAGVPLEQWTIDHVLQKEPDRVEITHDDGSTQKFGLVADAFYVLGIQERVAHHFLEYDRATVTVAASMWTEKSWRRKIQGYLALGNSDRLKERYGADALWVMIVVEGGEVRLENLVQVAEDVAGERANHFWVTTTERMEEKNLLIDAMWTVGGMPRTMNTIL